MSTLPVRRRDRLRAETSAEIKGIALRQLSAGGASSVSLRAIAREMGMTAGALYSYYDTRDALVTVLLADAYGSLSDLLEAARTTRPDTDPAGQLLAVALAYRKWATDEPEGFRLVYGDPVPGYRVPQGGAAPAAEQAACGVLLRLVAASWAIARDDMLLVTGVEWADFQPSYASLAREQFPDLPPSAVALSLRIWGRLHGLVALEVYGHLGSQSADPAKLYLSEVLDLKRVLGLAGGVGSAA